ncbi:MAG: hypothetical protein J6B79_05715 [Clostridia bacterium]|nr:hypothetical protein [Clostridia bacterium]
MKRRVRTKVFLPIFFALVLAISGIALVVGTKGFASADVSNVIAGFESEYKAGTEIAVPDAYFTDGGEQIKANKYINCPDGTRYVTDKITLATMGEYTVTYWAMTDSGKYLTTSKKFSVYSNLYDVVGKNNSASYGAHPLTPNTQGIMVGLSANGEFKFNKVINLNGLGDKNPFISMYVTPETIREYEAQEFTIKLTDIYDPTNFVKIRVISSISGNGYAAATSYIQAGASFQPLTGYEKKFNKLHQNNSYGFPQVFTFYGCDTKGEANENFLTAKNSSGQLQLFLDLDTKKVLTQGSDYGDREIIDLDNPKHFSEPWEGFSTGEVFLSITAKDLSKNNFNFVITSVANEDLTALKITDNDAPRIDIDTLGYDAKNLPRAVAGQPYPVFSATAIDSYSGKLTPSVRVYQNYGSPTQSSVSVKDGKFTPEVPGNYYVVYKATDYSGNVSEIVHVIVCDKTSTPVSLNVETNNRVTSSSVGELITLPTASASGGSGKIAITPVVTDGSGKEVEIIDNAFLPMRADTYTVRFTAIDYVSTQAVYEYEVAVTVSDKPVFERDVVLPKRFIAGYDYTLPTIIARDFSAQEVNVPVTIKITDDDGERTLDGNIANFKLNEVGATKTMKIRYESTNSAGTTVREYPVTVVNVKRLVNENQRLDVGRYFFTENATVTTQNDYVEISATENASVEFINPLIADKFACNFFMGNENDAPQSVTVKLTDENDSNKSLVLKLSQGNLNNTNVLINGAGPYETAINYANGEFNVSYDAYGKKIALDGTNFISVTKWEDGSAFDGFASGRVRLCFDFEGVSDTAIIRVRRINGQEIAEKTVLDRVAPRISTTTEGTRTREINEVVTLFPAIASDVLDPEVSLTVRVFDPTGNVVTDEEGLLLGGVSADREYKIKLSMYGQYRVTYSTKDDAGNAVNASVLFTVIDKEKSVIVISRNNATSVKKNTVVVFAPFSAIDDNTPEEEMTVCCFVICPMGTIYTVNMKDCNSFIASETGTYVLRYFAVDGTGNATIVDQELTVTE